VEAGPIVEVVERNGIRKRGVGNVELRAPRDRLFVVHVPGHDALVERGDVVRREILRVCDDPLFGALVVRLLGFDELDECVAIDSEARAEKLVESARPVAIPFGQPPVGMEQNL